MQYAKIFIHPVNPKKNHEIIVISMSRAALNCYHHNYPENMSVCPIKNVNMKSKKTKTEIFKAIKLYSIHSI